MAWYLVASSCGVSLRLTRAIIWAATSALKGWAGLIGYTATLVRAIGAIEGGSANRAFVLVDSFFPENVWKEGWLNHMWEMPRKWTHRKRLDKVLKLKLTVETEGLRCYSAERSPKMGSLAHANNGLRSRMETKVSFKCAVLGKVILKKLKQVYILILGFQHMNRLPISCSANLALPTRKPRVR